MASLRDMLRSAACAVLLASLVGGGCSNSTGPGGGSAGPAILVGAAPPGVAVIVYRPRDYSWPLGRTTVPAGGDSFRVSGLPADTVDVVNMGGGYFASKECGYVLQEGENVFEPALSDTSYLDDRGWPTWVLDELLVKFKDATIDSSGASSILMAYGCSVRRASRSLFTVDIPDTRTVPEMIDLLTLDERTRYACPNGILYPDNGGVGEVY